MKSKKILITSTNQHFTKIKLFSEKDLLVENTRFVVRKQVARSTTVHLQKRKPLLLLINLTLEKRERAKKAFVYSEFVRGSNTATVSDWCVHKRAVLPRHVASVRTMNAPVLPACSGVFSHYIHVSSFWCQLDKNRLKRVVLFFSSPPSDPAEWIHEKSCLLSDMLQWLLAASTHEAFSLSFFISFRAFFAKCQRTHSNDNSLPFSQ